MPRTGGGLGGWDGRHEELGLVHRQGLWLTVRPPGMVGHLVARWKCAFL